MSDEPKSRQFRLKPRLSADDQEVATPDATNPASSAADPQPETKPKFRLKPRLAPATETSDEMTEEQSETPIVEPLPESAAAAFEETSQPAPAPEAVEPTPEIPISPIPVVGQDSSPAKAVPSGAPKRYLHDTIPPTPFASEVEPAAVAAADDDAANLEEEEPAPSKKTSNPLLVGLLALIIIGGGGYYGWQHFMGAEPSVDSTPDKPTAQPTIQAKAESMTEDLMAKAKKMAATGGVQDPELVAAVMGNQSAPPQKPDGPLYRQPSAFGRIQSVASNNASPAAPADSEPEASSSAQPAPAEELEESPSRISPGVTATTSAVMATAEASEQFRAFVGAVRINGVFQGSPARALINGHTYREGAVVDEALGIIFDHVEASEKQIIFKDESGAIVRRKY